MAYETCGIPKIFIRICHCSHQDLLQGREPVGVAGLLGRRLVSIMTWQRLRGFLEGERGVW